ncbi:hypothetical protein ACROYT_G016037 [Oculina patagonica]
MRTRKPTTEMLSRDVRYATPLKKPTDSSRRCKCQGGTCLQHKDIHSTHGHHQIITWRSEEDSGDFYLTSTYNEEQTQQETETI